MVSQNAVNEDDIILNEVLSDSDIPGEPLFKAYIETTVYDEDGNVIQYHRQPMRSLTEYFLGLMAVVLIGTYQSSSTYNIPPLIANILGLPNKVSASTSYITWSWSIQLGSGTQNFSPKLSSLALPYVNGTSAGQLEYGALSVSYTQTSITVSTTVFNPVSNTVTVSEIGLFATITVGNASTYNFLLSYDTFSTPISIPGNGLATFQITLTFSG